MKRAGTIGVLVLAGFVYVCLNIVQVWSVGRSNDSREVDAIVVMGVAQYDGRPSPQLQARLDHVLTLWKEGVAQLVVTTGGNQPGDRFTEARASADYLIASGKPMLLSDCALFRHIDESVPRYPNINFADIVNSYDTFSNNAIDLKNKYANLFIDDIEKMIKEIL